MVFTVPALSKKGKRKDPIEVMHLIENRQRITEAGVGARIGVGVRGMINGNARKGDCLTG